MKSLQRFAFIAFAFGLLASCTSVRVVSDYDQKADFDTYKSYAFYKTGIDKAQISDLDKKRILRAIETEMGSRGFVKSDNPDVLISIFTKEREQVDVYNNNFGWGGNNVSTRTEGSLYIDVIDANRKELVWQGRGVGTLNNIKNIEKKEQRIKEFVAQILEEYPPQMSVASN
ncbi:MULTISPECIES: DUF4136 domain-containing protein [unclassified Allomuricauda]|uniref:DUF4136 domain-containing protein n=1 Tax=unclassified Allomuricauda TaxID=2615049 RepID=UPI00273E5C6C|nr:MULTISPECIES: DUF4136 domain-containing protein [unclassified Allomuricauda]